jgi:mono/diheme cytochrome c family protein
MALVKRVVAFAQIQWTARLVAILFGVLAADLRSEPIELLRGLRSDYLLNCGGCHGFQGVSNAQLVPSLKDSGLLRIPEGRAHLPRLPNVAFSTLSDEKFGLHDELK